jgi:hypothetical protein
MNSCTIMHIAINHNDNLCFYPLQNIGKRMSLSLVQLR